MQEYINSGILEQYCLGLLTPTEREAVLVMSAIYPEIKKDLAEIELAMERLALANAVTPGDTIKQKIVNTINQPEITLDNLPATNQYSDYQLWLKAVEHLIPAQPFNGLFAQPLPGTDKIEQTLIVTNISVPEETHNNLLESFFILEGHCNCKVGKHTYTLNPGDFLEIPLNTDHDVVLTSPYVIAILQRQLI